ncbi:MAG: ABC transporter ATP-binding protein [Candidatus Dactylopiibacterium sp.]|nr:ABC transporter ATP-binding protein [Candidatus Dactylopiibacterium sp.]
MFSDEIAVRVSNVFKRFELYAHPKDQLKQLVLPRIRRTLGVSPRQYFREFWALTDVSLELKRGESCGIVGLNGSGKSTLLQIIAGTLSPTRGDVSVQGRVAALLELGAGFNPEFSGRDNVYMSGILLGYSRRQVDEKFDQIVDFAELSEHIDQPLNSYSSGMQMRLAFSVATAFDPDILIVDEALAVGDAYFQQKCFHRINGFKERGGALLFVSHDANAVKQMCDKALLLEGGRNVAVGPPREIVDLYQAMIARKSDLAGQEFSITQGDSNDGVWAKATTISSNGGVDLLDFSLEDHDGKRTFCIESESRLVVRYALRVHRALDRPAYGLIIRDRLGRSVFETSTYAMRMEETPVGKGENIRVSFAFDFNLRAGQYSFSIGVANRGFSRSEFEEHVLLMHDVEQIQVVDAPEASYYGGIFNMKPVVSVEAAQKGSACSV